MIRVVFNHGYEMYNPGERAGFSEDKARLLVKRGIAHIYEEDAPKIDVRPAVERVGPIGLDKVSAQDTQINERVFPILTEANIGTAQDLMAATVDELVALPQIGIATAKRLHTAAHQAIQAEG